MTHRLSLNQITVADATLEEAVRLAATAGLPHVGLWRHKVAEVGAASARALCDDAGVRISSLCRGGFFTGHLPPGETFGDGELLAENRRAIDEAAELGAGVLVLVCGGAGRGDVHEARRRVAEGITALVPHAADRGVRLGIEPLHPMYCADRSVVVTIDQALAIAAPHPPEHVGVVLDAFHVWWDPEVEHAIARARGRIAGFHVCDWLLDPPDMLTGRGVMGDGAIDLRRLRELVDDAGYDGPIEVEILNRELWSRPPAEVIDLVARRYAEHVA